LQSVIPPILVSRGEQVKIELNRGALRLSTLGKAMSDAHLGQEIRVVNLSSNKMITATTIGDGLVEVRQ
jgi:flagella basal body P-ring formation protein FlgA